MKYRKGLEKILRPLNICDKDELTFEAAIIILCIYANGVIDPAGIRRYTHYESHVIVTVLGNLTKFGIIEDGILYLDDGKLSLFSLTLTAMVGAGILACKRVETDIGTSSGNHLKAVI